MSIEKRSLIGAELVGLVQSLLQHNRIGETGAASAQRLVDEWHADLAHDIQDNQSLPDFDSMNAETVGKEMAV